MDRLNDLAAKIEAYDPELSPDNQADELALHQDIVLATGKGSMNPAFEQTFVRSLDAAMTLKPKGWRVQTAIESQTGRWRFDFISHDGERDTPFDGRASGLTATPALALTAAALRAIASQGEG